MTPYSSRIKKNYELGLNKKPIILLDDSLDTCTDNKQKPIGTAFVPYVQNIANSISRILVQYNIKTIYLPLPRTQGAPGGLSALPSFKQPGALDTMWGHNGISQHAALC
jgi:hypothetical protein